MRTDVLHAYEDCNCLGQRQIVPLNYVFDYAFAWSPDGTRIAVKASDGVEEISAEDGDVLVLHPSGEIQGPMAWLRNP